MARILATDTPLTQAQVTQILGAEGFWFDGVLNLQYLFARAQVYD